VPLNARAAYRDTALTTAPPGRLLTMLYDRLARDLHAAATAIADRDLLKANEVLQHAQAIVAVLHEALDVEIWPAGKGLAQIYDFLAVHLMTANLKKSVTIVNECLTLVEPLGDAWREAYAGAPSAQLR
jgi:flagellar protein FliS